MPKQSSSFCLHFTQKTTERNIVWKENSDKYLARKEREIERKFGWGVISSFSREHTTDNVCKAERELKIRSEVTREMLQWNNDGLQSKFKFTATCNWGETRRLKNSFAPRQSKTINKPVNLLYFLHRGAIFLKKSFLNAWMAAVIMHKCAFEEEY